ncbi:MAG TPA: RNA methyltransferase [Candidatus Polarisedimenticolaceae bacterium]|nr:RNA methyltransferase [Candidatus Polarisedimenticolaceae bacterium]
MLTRRHPLVRQLRDLRRDAAARRDAGLLVAEGVHLVQEALASHATIETAVVVPRLRDLPEGRDLLDALRRRGVTIEEASDEVLDALQDARAPQPVLALVRHAARSLDDVMSGLPLVVVACGVQDPGNLGSLVRSTEAAGGTGLVATPGSADLTHPRTVRATMGSIFRLPSVAAQLPAVIEAARARGLLLLGASPSGTPYDEAPWTKPVALFLGAEGSGLPEALRGALDATVAIPMSGAVESLSVGAAGAVLLIEAARARRRA